MESNVKANGVINVIGNKSMMKTILCPVFIFTALILTGCSQQASEQAGEGAGTITREVFGRMSDGTDVHVYTMSNGKGLTVKATNYGGIITSIITPDKNGTPGDVVLGFESLTRYLAGHPHVGPLIGRYSGYIAGGKFTLDDLAYTVTANAGGNHLHGGAKAFDKVLWDATEITDANAPGLQLRYRSPEGEEGYPGNLDVEVTYRVTADNSLEISYKAVTDKKTPVNLTNHLYFNLSAMATDDVMQHELTIHAEEYAVPGKGNIPTGELRDVAGSELDFTSPSTIGSRIQSLPRGYDHNYVLKKTNDNRLILAASVHDPVSGRVMEVHTTHTGLEFASANWLNLDGKNGKHYGKSSGFLLYPQHLPDSPNRPDFPSTILEPGKIYSEKTVYRFDVRRE